MRSSVESDSAESHASKGGCSARRKSTVAPLVRRRYNSTKASARRLVSDMPEKLSGRTALITGGGGLIGAATCKLLAHHGAAVVVADILEGPAKAVVEDIVAEGGKAAAVVLDVADDNSIEAAVWTA